MRAQGHSVTLLSACHRGAGQSWALDNLPVTEVEKPRVGPRLLRARLESLDPDLLYWPFAWWRARGDAPVLRSLRAMRVGYIPGGRYRLNAVLRAAPALGLRHVAPYMAQALYPDKALVAGLRACGIAQVITMTEATRAALLRGGWPVDRVHTIWPGRDAGYDGADQTPVFDALKERIGVDPFFLFFGPPTPIRGIETVLDAFEMLRRHHSRVHLVCLFRPDANVDMKAVRARFEAHRARPGLYAVWDSVSRSELAAFLDTAHAAVLPFLLVPSEIPLAVIEAAGHGVPVITAGPGGTGDFVRAYGAEVRVADAQDLRSAMQRMLDDPEHHTACREAAYARFGVCQTWDRVSRRWLLVGCEQSTIVEGQTK